MVQIRKREQKYNSISSEKLQVAPKNFWKFGGEIDVPFFLNIDLFIFSQSHRTL